MEVPRRPLSRGERAVAYGLIGWAAEVGFTGVHGVLHAQTRSWRLEGHSYLWMLPIYGMTAVLFEPLHARLRGRPAWLRAAAYAAGITTVEYASGMLLRGLTGVVPWDYTGRSRFVMPGGAVRLDYLPVWAIAGLALERLHDTMLEIPAVPARSG